MVTKDGDECPRVLRNAERIGPMLAVRKRTLRVLIAGKPHGLSPIPMPFASVLRTC